MFDNFLFGQTWLRFISLHCFSTVVFCFELYHLWDDKAINFYFPMKIVHTYLLILCFNNSLLIICQ